MKKIDQRGRVVRGEEKVKRKAGEEKGNFNFSFHSLVLISPVLILIAILGIFQIHELLNVGGEEKKKDEGEDEKRGKTINYSVIQEEEEKHSVSVNENSQLAHLKGLNKEVEKRGSGNYMMNMMSKSSFIWRKFTLTAMVFLKKQKHKDKKLPL
jgi:hypothetical protein